MEELTQTEKIENMMERFSTVSFNTNISAKMVSTTNQRFKYLVGLEGGLQLVGMIGYFTYNNFHTSFIKKVIMLDNVLTLVTRNSMYQFEISDFEFIDMYGSGILFELSDNELSEIEDFIDNNREYY